jgi:cell division protein FtsL
MTRLSLMLLLAVMASAIYLVNVQYESRRLFAELNRVDQEARKLEAEYERLQVEKRAQATPARVEMIAREKFQMRGATPAITHYVSHPGRQLDPTTTALSPRPEGQREQARDQGRGQ